jgi:hypothetical protein
MNADEVLQITEQLLLSRQLTPVERLVLHQSWLGKGYSEIARDSGYGSIYIKEVGSHLWQDLSRTIGEKVNKKNLHIVLSHYQPKKRNDNCTSTAKQLQLATIAKNPVPNHLISSDIEFPGDPVPLNSPLYINRLAIEELAIREINTPGCVVRIKAPRKMGKSSLLNRIIVHASNIGYETVYLDFQEADAAIFSSLDKFLRWFCANISRQLRLNSKLEDYWDEEMGSKVSCKVYFQDYLLESIERPLVLALNEVNRVFEHPEIACDFLPMLRFWHELARAEEAWQKLRLVIVHSTEIYIPLKLNQSPFNVGLALKLTQFTSSQVQELAVLYGLNWTEDCETRQLMDLVGGHPYLVNLAFYHLSRGTITLQELLSASVTHSGIYSDHLRGYLAMLQEEPQLVEALQKVVTADGSVQIEALAAYKLESMGLVELEGDLAQPSCRLYSLYFCQQLGNGNNSFGYSVPIGIRRC